MGIQHIGGEDGQHLSHVHGGRQNKGSELLDQGVDKELPGHGGGGEHGRIEDDGGMPVNEAEGLEKATAGDQRHEGHHRTAAVHVEHLVVFGCLVLLEQFLLKS